MKVGNITDKPVFTMAKSRCIHCLHQHGKFYCCVCEPRRHSILVCRDICNYTIDLIPVIRYKGPENCEQARDPVQAYKSFSVTGMHTHGTTPYLTVTMQRIDGTGTDLEALEKVFLTMAQEPVLYCDAAYK